MVVLVYRIILIAQFGIQKIFELKEPLVMYFSSFFLFYFLRTNITKQRSKCRCIDWKISTMSNIEFNQSNTSICLQVVILRRGHIINSYFHNITTRYLVKKSNFKKIPITPVRNVLLTVLEGRPFQKKLLEAVVPVGYRTSHYKRENKMNPLSLNFR